ncbi:porin [Salinisphaera orenii]|uniref:porin n=1 Tax=Salinisphaera orenii TaxID=856731 RepID=UPI000DBE2364
MAQVASAVTLYGSPENRVILNGRLSGYSVLGNGTNHDDRSFHNAGSRIRLGWEHNLFDGWTAIAMSSWGFDPLFKDGQDHHYRRQEYVALTNPRYGTLTLGKQYSIFYEMAGIFTDYYWATGAAAQGSFNGTGDTSFEGMGRPSRSLSYRNRIGDWSFGLMYQTDDDVQFNEADQEPLNGAKRDSTIQTAIQWHASDDLTFAGVYSHSDIKRSKGGSSYHNDIDAGLLGLQWSPGNWYFGATAGQYNNLVRKGEFAGYDSKGWVDEARGYEIIAMYNIKYNEIPGDVQVYGGLNRLEDRDSEARNVDRLVGAAWLLFDHDLIFSVEQSFRGNSRNVDGESSAHNRTYLFARYNY